MTEERKSCRTPHLPTETLTYLSRPASEGHHLATRPNYRDGPPSGRYFFFGSAFGVQAWVVEALIVVPSL